MKNYESLPSAEADSASLAEFLRFALDQAALSYEECGQDDGFSKRLSDTESVLVLLRPEGSNFPIIEDWLTRQELPDVVVSCLRWRNHMMSPTSDLYSVQTETEEIWVYGSHGELRARKRLYSYERPNYEALGTLEKADRDTYLIRFEERRQEQCRRQPAIDVDEEVLGLNRVSADEINELMTSLQQAEG